MPMLRVKWETKFVKGCILREIEREKEIEREREMRQRERYERKS